MFSTPIVAVGKIQTVKRQKEKYLGVLGHSMLGGETPEKKPPGFHRHSLLGSEEKFMN